MVRSASFVGDVLKFNVEQKTTLLDALTEFMPNTSRSKLRKMLTEGRIHVDNTPEHKAKREISPGSQIEILSRVKAFEITPPPVSKQKKSNLSILWEDEAILVVEKPAGLLSIATDKLERDTLHARCVDHIQQEDEKNCAILYTDLTEIHLELWFLHGINGTKNTSKINLQNEKFTELITH